MSALCARATVASAASATTGRHPAVARASFTSVSTCASAEAVGAVAAGAGVTAWVFAAAGDEGDGPEDGPEDGREDGVAGDGGRADGAGTVDGAEAARSEE